MENENRAIDAGMPGEKRTVEQVCGGGGDLIPCPLFPTKPGTQPMHLISDIEEGYYLLEMKECGCSFKQDDLSMHQWSVLRAYHRADGKSKAKEFATRAADAKQRQAQAQLEAKVGRR